jgi:hypothetical protein
VTATSPVTVSVGSGGVTRSATLTVNPPTPAAPTLLAPANGATGVAQPVTLNWDDAAGATSYEVMVDDSSAVSAPYVANPTAAASEVQLTGLPVRPLWWRVRARNSAGVFGPFSSTRSFTPQATTSPPPSPPASGTLAAPSLLAPAVDARFSQGQTIVFDWSDLNAAAGALTSPPPVAALVIPKPPVGVPDQNHRTSGALREHRGDVGGVHRQPAQQVRRSEDGEYPALQMAERAGATITEVAGSHVSMVSHAQVTIDAIAAAAAAVDA